MSFEGQGRKDFGNRGCKYQPISGNIRRNVEKTIFLYKSIVVDPKIEISNISASGSPIFFYPGLVELV